MNPLTNVKNIQKLNERELELGVVGKKSWHDEYKDSAWVFIGGLPYDLSEGDIICVFSQYGEVVNMNLVRDHKTGKSKGFGFLCYQDQRSTVLAVDNLNSIKILGRIIRVDHVKDYKVPKEHKEDDELVIKMRDEGCAPKLQSDEKVLEGMEAEEGEKPSKKKKKEKKSKKKKKERKRESSSSSSGTSDDENDRDDDAELARVKKEIKQEVHDRGYDRATDPSTSYGNTFSGNGRQNWSKERKNREERGSFNSSFHVNEERRSFRDGAGSDSRRSEMERQDSRRKPQRDFDEFNERYERRGYNERGGMDDRSRSREDHRDRRQESDRFRVADRSREYDRDRGRAKDRETERHRDPRRVREGDSSRYHDKYKDDKRRDRSRER